MTSLRASPCERSLEPMPKAARVPCGRWPNIRRREAGTGRFPPPRGCFPPASPPWLAGGDLVPSATGFSSADGQVDDTTDRFPRRGTGRYQDRRPMQNLPDELCLAPSAGPREDGFHLGAHGMDARAPLGCDLSERQTAHQATDHLGLRVGEAVEAAHRLVIDERALLPLHHEPHPPGHPRPTLQ